MEDLRTKKFKHQPPSKSHCLSRVITLLVVSSIKDPIQPIMLGIRHNPRSKSNIQNPYPLDDKNDPISLFKHLFQKGF